MHLDKFKLDGRAGLVTRGARGVGLAIAEALGEGGAKIVLTDMSEGALGESVATLSAKGLRVEAEVLDVTDAAGIAISDYPAETMTDAVSAKVWRRPEPRLPLPDLHRDNRMTGSMVLADGGCVCW